MYVLDEGHTVPIGLLVVHTTGAQEETSFEVRVCGSELVCESICYTESLTVEDGKSCDRFSNEGEVGACHGWCFVHTYIMTQFTTHV